MSGVNNGGSIANGASALIQFISADSDEYYMAIQNANGSYGGARTPVAGIYRVSCASSATMSVGGGRWNININYDRGLTLDSNGGVTASGPTGATIVSGYSSNGSAGVVVSAQAWTDIFLEKDCVVWVQMVSSGGSAGVPATGKNQTWFSLELLSTENGLKTSDQIW
jgi:hypothetical protein